MVVGTTTPSTQRNAQGVRRGAGLSLFLVIQMVRFGKSDYLNLNEMVGLVLAPDRTGSLLTGKTPVR